jgi:ankyrin repeat protein
MTTNEQWSQLSRKIRDGNISEFKTLLENHGVDPNLQDDKGSSLLHEAVLHRSDLIVKMLVEKEEVDVNARNKRGRTPLWEAASRGSKADVELLLDNVRVDLETRDENGQTPLSAAAMQQGGHLMSAAATAHESVVEALLASGLVDPDAKDARGLTPLAWASRARQGSVRIVEMLLSTGKVDANSEDELGITPLMWSAAFSNDKIKELLLNSGKLVGGLELDTGSGNVDRRFITHWMESCNAQHGGQCEPAPLEQRLPQQLPHWVIDISRACLVAGNTVSRYVALSYVWSQGFFNDLNDKRPPDSILLKKLNLSDFRTPGYLKEVLTQLPTAVKDAIPLVRKLGENHLWVDCLCIVQDDEKTREQVDHMGDIYSGAYLTIIAATPLGRLHGFSSPFYGGRAQDEKVEDLYEDLYRTNWASRGWTFQEQMLSRRAVVFNYRYMFWECQQCVWSPDGPRPEITAPGRASFTVPHYEKASRMLSCSYPDFDLYTEMISLYNSRVFTYPQDVLPAFSGILTTLGRNFPSGFQYGLPRIHLDIALLWQPFRKAYRRVRRDENSGIMAPKAHLPSWSWCGWTCPVDPYHLRTRSSYFNQDSRTSQMPVWRTQKLVQWYSLPEDMHCQVPADRPLRTKDGSSINYKDDISSSILATQIGETHYPPTEAAETVHLARQETDPSPPLSSTPLATGPQYSSQPHDTWPFLACETSCLTLHIKAVLYSYPASWRNVMAFRPGYPSIFKLSQFANGPTVANACDLICLENQEGLRAGMLRNMEEAKLKPGDTVELMAISTGAINSTGVEGDEDDEFYRHEMEAYIGMGPVYAKTSEYLGQYHNSASIFPSKA